VWRNLLTWRSKKGVVARSSVEAEFRAMNQAICEDLWIQSSKKTKDDSVAPI
jgi:hypothetical protein